MISKNECLDILVKMEDKGIEVNSYMKKLLTSKEIPLEVLKFISANYGLDAVNFYEMLRKKHNQKKSPLYSNILKGQTDEKEILITLSCLLTQIVLFSKKLESPDIFLKEARAEEITRVLNSYFKDGSLESCLTILQMIKTDLMVLEYIAERRELSK